MTNGDPILQSDTLDEDDASDGGALPETFIEAVADHHAHPATLSEPHSLLLVAAESVASRLVKSGAELEHGQNAGLRALGLDVTDALAIARQVEDDVAQLLQAFSS